MIPSVGRIVHYVSYGTPGGEYKSVCRAAIIASVTSNELVHLVVFNPEGLFFNHCIYSEPAPDGTHPGGTWHWPERVTG